MGTANRTGRPPIFNGLFRLTIAAVVLITSCGTAGGGPTPRAYTASRTFPSFNPFTGPDASFGPEMSAGCFPAARLINKQPLRLPPHRRAG